jgi:hypothetical protein
MNMEYNTGRGRMIIPEYGRHIQKLIEYAVSLDDREERNKLARAIVNVMGQLNPQLRDITDFKHKLWDHLFIISDFKLDVDSPYDQPTALTYKVKPQQVPYPKHNIRYRHYGGVIEQMVREVAELEESPKRDQLILNLANFMKMLYVSWNKDSVTDAEIFEHIRTLSKGKIDLNAEVRLNENVEVPTNLRTAPKKANTKRSRTRATGNGGPKNYRK